MINVLLENFLQPPSKIPNATYFEAASDEDLAPIPAPIGGAQLNRHLPSLQPLFLAHQAAARSSVLSAKVNMVDGVACAMCCIVYLQILAVYVPVLLEHCTYCRFCNGSMPYGAVCHRRH